LSSWLNTPLADAAAMLPEIERGGQAPRGAQ
jgi:hypothetical protein